jgi:hypothetical protein
MKRHLLSIVALALTVALAALVTHAADPTPATKPDEKPKTHTVAADPASPVITYDTKGGMIMRKSDDPVLQILADGTITASDPYGGGKKAQSKLTPAELQEILRFILDRQKLADIKPDDLRMKGLVMVTDASTTSLTVEADGAKQQFSVHALDFVAGQAGPDSAAARLVAITHRLSQLADITKLGGQAAFQKLLDAANAALKTQSPADGPLTAQDLIRADAPADGSTAAFFNHKTTLPSGQWHMVSVTINQPKTGEPTIKIQKGADMPAQ